LLESTKDFKIEKDIVKVVSPARDGCIFAAWISMPNLPVVGTEGHTEREAVANSKGGKTKAANLTIASRKIQC